MWALARQVPKPPVNNSFFAAFLQKEQRLHLHLKRR
jgi:hypothetical protein